MREGTIEMLERGCGLVFIARDGARCVLDAGLLWSECPSAQGRVRRMASGSRLDPPPGLFIKSVQEIGTYGVNIAFSDGHDRGIYPWGYLAALAAKPTLEDFLYD